MATECSPDLFGFTPVEGRPVAAAFDAGLATSDAGALLLGATDQAIGLIGRFAAGFDDARRPDLVEHRVATLVGQRVIAIALGYEDLNDHDQRRHDPALAGLAGKLAAKRRDGAPVAGKSTLNRLELGTPVPAQIVLDLDATDDPLHGQQEGRFFHGYCDGYGDLPRYVFCGRHLLAAKRRRSNVDAAAGAVDEVARLVAEIAPELARARAEAEAKRRPARRYTDLAGATLDSWSCRRRVVGKAEWLAGRGDGGGNPRFVVTSLRRHAVRARRLYPRLYCARGEMENRIKECQLDLFADRTSAATMRANQLRLRFASMAHVLLCARRRIGLAHTRFAHATCGTIRLKLLKIAACVRISVRRIRFALPSAFPYQAEFAAVHRRLSAAAA